MKHKTFDDVDITAGQKSEYSDWIHLPDNYTLHAINGYHEGAGSLAVYYQISAAESSSYVDEDIRIAINGIRQGVYTVFHEVVYLLPNEYIRFYAVEEGGTGDISGLDMVFVQKGRVG